MNKKAQIQTKVFIYILTGIVIVLLLLFGIRSCYSAIEQKRAVDVAKFQTDLDSAITEIEFGSVKEQHLDIPSDVDLVCLMDLSRRKDLLKSPVLKQFPEMWDSINSSVKKNIFFISRGKVVDSLYTADICFDSFPYYTCLRPRASTLDLFIEGEGTCGLILSGGEACAALEGSGAITKPITVGDGSARLNIPNGATVTFPADNYDLCMGPVPDDADYRLSESYNITPEGTTVSQGSVTMSYFVGTPVNTNHIKIKQFISNMWNSLTTAIDGMREEANSDVSTTPLSRVAVFGPEPPKAVITTTPVSESLVFSKKSDIIFSASGSTDPDNDIVSYSWDFGNENTADTEESTQQYAMAGSYVVELVLTDSQGNEGRTQITITIINAQNFKDMGLYTDQVFLAAESSGYQGILMHLPIVMWKSIDGDEVKPYRVYHKEGTVAQADYRLSDLKGAHPIIQYFGTVDTEISTYEFAQSAPDYFSFWKHPTDPLKSGFEDIVVIGYTNEPDALLASLYASFLNAPIIFINFGNIDNYDAQLLGKTAYVVGDLGPLYDTIVQKVGVDGEIVDVTSADLQDTMFNPYSELSSEVGLISNNPWP